MVVEIIGLISEQYHYCIKPSLSCSPHRAPRLCPMAGGVRPSADRCCIYIYIYICRERERCIYEYVLYIYIYIYTHTRACASWFYLFTRCVMSPCFSVLPDKRCKHSQTKRAVMTSSASNLTFGACTNMDVTARDLAFRLSNMSSVFDR